MAAALELAPARDVASDIESRCAALARGGGATRRALAEPAKGFVRIHGWERLGFVRLADYAVGTVARATDSPFASPVDSKVDPAADSPDRHAGAQPTGRPRRDLPPARDGPRDVMRLFHATPCTVRRHLERRTGRYPTPGEAFEAMLDHALQEWLPREKRRARKAEPVYELGLRAGSPSRPVYG